MNNDDGLQQAKAKTARDLVARQAAPVSKFFSNKDDRQKHKA